MLRNSLTDNTSIPSRIVLTPSMRV